VAAVLGGAVAADGEVGAPGQNSEKVKEAARVRRTHFRLGFAPERPPAFFVVAVSAGVVEEVRRGRKRRKPDVVLVEARIIAFAHAARRTPDGPDADALPG
jgi:hypothetical protein